MHPRTTNISTRSLDDPGFIFESAGALGFVSSGYAVISATILPSQNPSMHGPDDDQCLSASSRGLGRAPLLCALQRAARGWDKRQDCTDRHTSVRLSTGCVNQSPKCFQDFR